MSDRGGSMDRQENGSGLGSLRDQEENGSPRGSRDRRGSGSPRRSRSRSGSRSRSNRKGYHSRSRDDYRERGRERQAGDYDGGRRNGKAGSPSPMSASRNSANANRETPAVSRCLGIFGLSIYTQERDLKDVLGKYGPIEDVQIVYDAQTGRSRGFAFVYFEQVDDAKEAKERVNGIEIDGRKIRVDFSITQRAHTPTPGIYMGKPTRRGRDYYHNHGGYDRRNDYHNRRDDYGGGGRQDGGGRHYDSYSYGGDRRGGDHHRGNGYGRERSPSPYRGRGSGSGSYSRRERSRSYSPRKYSNNYY